MPDSLSTCTFGSEHLTVTVLPEAGARLHRLEAFGVSLLRMPPATAHHREDPFHWGGYHMAPWCNRLDTAPVRVGARTVRLAPNFPDGSAIHGQVFAAPWRQADAGHFVVDGGGDGWPWTYELRLHMTAQDATLRLAYRLTNTSDAPMPAGVGFHPWFRRPSLVRIPATSGFPDNAQIRPHPGPLADGMDLRIPGPLPDGIDATWTGLTAPVAELAWPDEGVAMTMKVAADDDPVIVAAHPTALRAVAVEPQTHAPAGLRRLLHGEPHPMRLLDPGDVLTLGVALIFRPDTDLRGAAS